jgi:hypothetical protein
MLGSLVESGLLDYKKALAIHQVGATENATHKAALITYYRDKCPALWFEARPTPSTAYSTEITLKVPMKDLEDSIFKLPASSSYESGWYYNNGFNFKICLDISGDSPSTSNATLSIIHRSVVYHVVPKQIPFPIAIQILHPQYFGLAKTHRFVLESSREAPEGKTEIFSRPALAPLASDIFWRHVITDAQGELTFKVTVK